MSSDSVASPFPAGVVDAELEKQVVSVRRCLTTWLTAKSDIEKSITGSRERMRNAMLDLIDLEVVAPYAFEPSPPFVFRRVLLSCVKTYWIALELFDGARCVEMADKLNEQEYEGLMRTIHLVALGMVNKDVSKSWREIAEVGVQTWEEEGDLDSEDEDEDDEGVEGSVD